MERIMIIGCGGSGKSTLARELGEKLKLPVIHLDQIFWSPGNWQHLERDTFDERLRQEMEKPRWILDGNYDRTLPMRLEKCDTVIYLDYNRFVCLFGWLKRVIANWGKTRADMGPHCNERLDPKFAKWLWTFNKKNRRKYHAILAEQKNKEIYIFKNRRQLRKFLRGLETGIC